MIDTKIVENFNNTLQAEGLTIFCSESITAGLLASTIASVSGASSVLKGSIVTYDADLKIKILSVDPSIIKEHTAESQETTDAMCIGLKNLYPSASLHVAVTGVASLPKDDSYVVNKEVGQIYVSVMYKEQLHKFSTVCKPKGDDERNSIRYKAVEYIFDQITKII
ncbi:nicotinamide-nucleotide amidohydrolase family protein [Sphingobacterium faecium]|uniref:CinA family protein n=1 Tax=Sphingobacterium faecium TaxID=34087 RepID=UPI0012914783|nr:nicotinamide-nucleotide amidohydrolase family protein [Sphingobacterium faecium]MQP30287.1 nicotinamide-nucleotide amidohydrolase family protein [Sphingobacterium faecium]